ncbi:GNAT family N-acetyltransferase [Microtetraspora sp. NBRC 13810]|uniref:GNAT family N-acetyltransferase n=1 Tax=Microtetraspora sp. NBRC 13810 TaxID=3030990 RepID=UPI002552A2BC|nr:GNAT family N-acetyltransferase [Microtetraspora sp. NBRC 13810]
MTGYDVVLRPWTEDDLATMAELFDDPGIAYRTPLASPFDLTAAREYLEMIRRSGEQRVHFAVTTDGGQARGEVLVNLAASSMGWAVGAAHRGQGLAARAVRLLVEHAHETLAMPRLYAQIEPDNHASMAVAKATGFQLTDEAPQQVADKGRSYELLTWLHTV